MTGTQVAESGERVVLPLWLVPASLALSVLGLLASAYLTYEHYTAGSTLACPETATFNCAKVTSSRYSEVLGIPVAVLGLAFFVAMTALCSPPAWRATGGAGRLLRLARVAGVVAGVASVVYLVWAELFAVGALCLWCTGVHVVTVALFAVVLLGSALVEDTSPDPRLRQ